MAAYGAPHLRQELGPSLVLELQINWCYVTDTYHAVHFLLFR